MRGLISVFWILPQKQMHAKASDKALRMSGKNAPDLPTKSLTKYAAVMTYRVELAIRAVLIWKIFISTFMPTIQNRQPTGHMSGTICPE